MTLVFCYAATASQVAIPISESTFWFFAYLNMAGASGFGIVMICLFLIYPSRLPAWRFLTVATVLGFGGWTLASMFGPLKNYSNVQLITLCEMILIIIAVIWQVWADVQVVRAFHSVPPGDALSVLAPLARPGLGRTGLAAPPVAASFPWPA